MLPCAPPYPFYCGLMASNLRAEHSGVPDPRRSSPFWPSGRTATPVLRNHGFVKSF